MRYITAGESHGPKLTVIIEGVPAGLELVAEDINKELSRRQKGYGRGRRMQIEKDTVEITSGVRHGYTLGSPITLVVTNDDYKHWTHIMGAEPFEDDPSEIKRVITRPRPGHADLNGAIKYGHRDIRNILERSSARETTMRVAVGAVAKKILSELGVNIVGHVKTIGKVEVEEETDLPVHKIVELSEQSEVRCLDSEKSELMKVEIDTAKKEGDSLGGIVEVVAEGMPIGMGSYVQYDKKLDAKVAMAILSINAFKGVEFGIGFKAATTPGSQVHDEIIYDKENGYTRASNRLGGFEGGMTTGMPIVVRGVMKPIPTLYKPLRSVDIETKETFQASIERSDACAVPAAAVVAEHVVAFELANAIIEEFQSAQMGHLKQHVESYRAYTREF